jgi:Arc/MetJ-type ribon-helix-helix transcriptional regulator
MVSAKFTLSEQQVEFINRHRELGYPDKSSLVRHAIDRMRREVRERRLSESAALYAELYDAEEELRTLTGQAVDGWPR